MAVVGSILLVKDTSWPGGLSKKPVTTRAMPTPMPAPKRTMTGVIVRRLVDRCVVAEVGQAIAQTRWHGEVVHRRTAALGLGEDLGRDDVGAVGVLHHTDGGHEAPGQTRGVGALAHEDDQVECLGGELGGRGCRTGAWGTGWHSSGSSRTCLRSNRRGWCTWSPALPAVMALSMGTISSPSTSPTITRSASWRLARCTSWSMVMAPWPSVLASRVSQAAQSGWRWVSSCRPSS